MHKSNLTDLRDVHAIAGQALAAGAERTAINSLDWNVAGPCQNPIPIEKYGRPYPDQDGYVTVKPFKTEVPFGVVLRCPCRVCDACRKRRQWEWHHRAYAEMLGSPRTWFATLTLRPASRLWFLNQARQLAATQGDDFEALTDEMKFGRLCRVVGKEVTRYLARLRKHSAPFRYLVVYERHKDGLPHLHGLLHETVEGSQTERLLRKQWLAGHSMFKCVDLNPAVAGYVAKYLAKANLARVRASLRYGKMLTASADSKAGKAFACYQDPSPATKSPIFEEGGNLEDGTHGIR